MRNKLLLLFCFAVILCFSGCSSRTDDHTASVTVPQTTAPAAGANAISSVGTTYSSADNTVSSTGLASEDSSSSVVANGPDDACDDYPYDPSSDRQLFNFKKIDINVGNRFYMTQINDWYKNYSEYEGKSVTIEGFYLIFNKKYSFIGRKGPTCPFCTGGYVDFEFKSDKKLKNLVPEKSWIQVTGILRQGTAYPGCGKAGKPFYYIEALNVKKLPKVGISTISN